MKISILTGKFGMGHLSAAKNLAHMLEAQLPGAQAEVTDIYELAFRQHADRFYDAYSTLMKLGGKAINLAYGKAVHKGDGLPASLSPAEAWLGKVIDAYLIRSAPDAVITTYSLASRLVAERLSATASSIPHITCITDVGVHNVWVNADTQLYLAACAETARELEQRGVDSKRIAITGVPVCAELARTRFRVTASARPSLLIMGGGLGLMPTDPGFYAELDRQNRFDIIVVTAGNSRLRRNLERLPLANTTVLGYTNQVPQLMMQADALVSKPGGVSTFEAIHAQLPLLMLPPHLEQEKKNCSYVLARRMGMLLPEDERAAAARISLTLANRELLGIYRRNMQAEQQSFDQHTLADYLLSLDKANNWSTAS